MNEEKHNPERNLTASNGAGKKLFKNPDALKWVIIGLAGFVVLMLVFGAGVKVGALKAQYSYKWAETYHKNFGGPRGGFLGDWRRFPAGDFINGHGAFGEIIELNDSGFVIKGREDVEKIIIISEETTITKGRETIKDGLKVGDRVVIIGAPNNEGQIEAKLIRVFDENGPGLPMRPGRSFPFF